MPVALLGFAFLVFGAVSLVDAARIASTTRLRGTLDLVGPDGYLRGVAILLLVLGVLMLVQGVLAMRAARAVKAPPRVRLATDTDAPAGSAHWALLVVLVVYAMVLPWLGYCMATLLFLIAVFRVMNMRSWTTVLLSSVGLTALFYVAFAIVADLPLPVGFTGIG